MQRNSQMAAILKLSLPACAYYTHMRVHQAGFTVGLN